MVNRPAANQSAAESSDALKQKKANETQQAVVLFIIVLVSECSAGKRALVRDTHIIAKAVGFSDSACTEIRKSNYFFATPPPRLLASI